MLSKTIARSALCSVVLASAGLLGQTAASQTTSSRSTPGQTMPAATRSAAAFELPAFMRQNVVAGTTPVGTKVQAKLAVATLLSGVVVPQDAILSGEVTESLAKSATSPSHLAIRMDSAEWKNRSAPLVLAPKLYLTAWYYPALPPGNQDLSSGLPDAANSPRLRTGGTYPGPRNPTAPPFPDAGTGVDTNPPPAADISKHRVLMKNIESTTGSDGAVTLTSKHSNIKLDKTTTYVFAAGDLASGPAAQ